MADAAPSPELRKWFAHEPSRWAEFQRRYCTELDADPSVLEPILAEVRRGRVTFVFASREDDGYLQLMASREDEVGEDRSGRILHFDDETSDLEGRYLIERPIRRATDNKRSIAGFTDSRWASRLPIRMVSATGSKSVPTD